MSHYSAIGFDSQNDDAFEHLIHRCIDHISATYEGKTMEYHRYDDESGAQLWLNTDKHGNIRAVEPAYHATTVQHVAIQGISRVDDDGTAEIHLWLNGRSFDGDECSDGDYPLIISVPNGQLLPRKLSGKTTTARLIAIADDDISTYADTTAYAATQTGEGSIAANAVIPAGMFTDSHDQRHRPRDRLQNQRPHRPNLLLVPPRHLRHGNRSRLSGKSLHHAAASGQHHQRPLLDDRQHRHPRKNVKPFSPPSGINTGFARSAASLPR